MVAPIIDIPKPQPNVNSKIELKNSEQTKELWLYSLFNGDVHFVGFTLDIQPLSNQFGKCLEGFKTISEFTLNYAQSFTLQRGLIMSNWTTVVTHQDVPPNHVAHFEVAFNNNKTSIIGVVGNTVHTDGPIGDLGNESGVGIMLEHLSIIENERSHGREFANTPIKNGQRVGIFIDMREPENGRIFLTHKGVVVGQIRENVRTPIRPAVSLLKMTHERAKASVKVYNDCPYPIGWNDPKFRIRKGEPDISTRTIPTLTATPSTFPNHYQ
jgi:hypothetical protein